MTRVLVVRAMGQVPPVLVMRGKPMPWDWRTGQARDLASYCAAHQGQRVDLVFRPARGAWLANGRELA